MIPSGWAHAVTNLDPGTAGGALEFHRSGDPEELAMGLEYRRRELAGVR